MANHHRPTLAHIIGLCIAAICGSAFPVPSVPSTQAPNTSPFSLPEPPTPILSLGLSSPRIDILLSESPEPAQAADPITRQETLALFGFDAAAAADLFTDSHWLVVGDRFSFSPASTGEDEARDSAFRLEGTCLPVLGDASSAEPVPARALHGTKTGPTGSRLSLDLLLLPGDDGWSIDGAYSFELRDFLQAGRLSGRLIDAPVAALPAPADQMAVPLRFGQQTLPATFAITLTGQTFDTDFADVPATLSLEASSRTDEIAVSILSVATPEVGAAISSNLATCGAITWLATARVAAEGPPPEGTARQIPFQLKQELVGGGRAPGLAFWDAEHCRDAAMREEFANADRGTLTLSIDAQDRIKGEIEVTGTALSGRRATYRAVFTGMPAMPPSFQTTVTDTEASQQIYTSDDTAVIEGVPVPALFDIKLRGRVDDRPLGPLDGELRVHPAGGDSDVPLHLILFTEDFGALGIGSLSWDVAPGTTEDMTLKDGRISATLAPSATGLQASMTWGAPDRRTVPTAPTPALPRRASLALTIDGETVQGSIIAAGFLLDDTAQPSEYHAELQGRLRSQRTLIDEHLSEQGVLPFTGRWRSSIPSLDPLLLKAEGTARTGYAGGTDDGESTTSLRGEFARGLLRLQWQREKVSGWGFLRLLGGGSQAIGLWGEEGARRHAQPWLLRQPPLDTPKAAGADVDIDDSELRQLNLLGRDLARLGKCDQAVPILEVALGIYLQRSQQRKSPTSESAFALVGAVQVIEPLIDCAFRSGRYPLLLKYLRQAIQVQALLTDDAQSNRLLQAHGDRLQSEIAGFDETLAQIADNLSVAQQQLDPAKRAGIGISLGGYETGQPLAVLGLMPGRPAESAGIRLGDRILAIDGAPVSLLSLAEVVAALSGEPDSRVQLHVQRDGAEYAVEVVREVLGTALPPERRDAARDLYRQLSGTLDGLRDALRRQAERLKALSARLASGQDEGPTAAFIDLSNATVELHDDLANQYKTLIALGEAAFGRWPDIMAVQQRLLAVLAAQAEAAPSAGAAAAASASADGLETLDQLENSMLHALDTHPEIVQIEADLFKQHYVLSMVLLGKISTLTLNIQQQHRTAGGDRDQQAQQRITATLRLADRVERARAQLQTDAGKLWALDEGQGFFADWIGLLWDLGARDEALVAAEAARNRASQDLFAGREQLAKDLRTAAGNDLRSPVAEPALTFEQLLALAEERGGTTIEYFVLPERTLVWGIGTRAGSSDAERIRARALPIGEAEIAARVEQFLALVGRAHGLSYQDGSILQMQDLLRAMHRALIAPIQHWLPEDPREVVTLIPHAQLYRIPFAALLGPSAGDPSAGERHLIEAHPLVHLPSIGMMRYTRGNRERAVATPQHHWLALVDPRDIGYSGLDPFGIDPERASEYCPPPSWGDRASDGRNAYLIGDDATVANLKSHASAARRLCIFAHARADEHEPEASMIALSGAALTLDQIRRLDLHADLVILAACETGRGRITGDGVLGFNRAFTFAGAPSLLMSLWQIPEGRTAAQLQQFHSFLAGVPTASGVPGAGDLARALQRAQIRMLQDTPLQPNLWAGLILFGEP